MVPGRRLPRPSSPMSTDSNMSPALTHKRPRRHKQNQCGELDYQPRDAFNDGKVHRVEDKYGLAHSSSPSCTDTSLFAASADSCTPLSFSGQVPPIGDYKVRGATLPRIGSGETRGRRGSTGMQRVKEAESEQRESQDKHKSPQGAKGSSRSRQHSGSQRWEFCLSWFGETDCLSATIFLSSCQNLGTSFCTVVRPSHRATLKGRPMAQVHRA